MADATPVLERCASRLALDHLRAIEWSHTDWPGTCGTCGSTITEGSHRPDCQLADAINVLASVDQTAALLIS